MSLTKGLLALGVGLACTAGARGAVIVEYNTQAATTTPVPADWTPTTVDPSLSAMQLTRGGGLTAAGLARGFMATSWGTAGPSSTWLANTSTAQAVANDDYFQWGFTVDANHQVSVSTLDLAMRRQSAASPDRFEVLVSADGFATAGTSVASWTYLGRGQGTAPGTVTSYQWMTTDTPGQDNGNPIAQQDLSGASILQNIAPGTTMTFRLYGWYDGTAAETAALTVAVGRQGTSPATSGGPSLGGTITLVPEPTTLSALAVAGLMGVRRRR